MGLARGLGQETLMSMLGVRSFHVWFMCLLAAFHFLPAAQASTVETLPNLPILTNRSSVPHTVEVDLVAEPARLSLTPGKLTNTYAYNGRVPGPTLEVREGDRVIVHFTNKLPEPTNVHWHGLHVPVEADGNPMDPVPSGGTYDYIFDIQPGQAGTYWYHPHPHGNVGRQISRGLYGALVVRASDDPLPASLPEKLLLLQDMRVNSRGSVIIPANNSDDQGWEGNVLLVNGQAQPTLSIRSGEVQRWRVVNASVARYYRLSLAGHTFLQVGSDGGLFERPVPRSEILVAPSERVELLVRGSGAPGTQAVLQSLPYDRYYPALRPKEWDKTLDLLTMQYTKDAPMEAAAIPEVLRYVPRLDPARASTTRHITLTFDARLNGQHFSPDRVDITAPLNATEIWQIENRDEMDHPFHLHGFSFQILDRDGVTEPFPAWEDTVNVPRGKTIRFVVEYRDYPGRRMFHCHILDHEDYGMMGVLEVR
jgi:FtsP/CotA-like multicopper oxidase with cupredoxin domain